jgi:gas vesicle protein
MNDNLKFITGLLVGSALGLCAGLLLAPTTGKQARKKIGKRSKKLAKKMASYIGMEQSIQGVSAKRRNGKAPVEAR